MADIVRACGAQYRATHRLSIQQQRVLRAIESCRTAALGGHAAVCDHCGALEVSFNSCRNRHCPKCQTLAKQRWVENSARSYCLCPIFTSCSRCLTRLICWRRPTLS
ncbi:MAG: hypothetical protein GY892_22665 [Shimia sp.]|nr:hypothetical protein [Shimia sp.]